MKTTVKLSVVVATRNRSASLARLFAGLIGQIGAPPFEVIIGDNGCNDDTADVIKQAQTKLTIRCVREERPGKSRALNAALKLARGELIIFTDDDVVPQPDWLAQLNLAASRYPDANIFGGLIDINLEEVPRWITRSHNLMELLTSAHRYSNSDILYTYGNYPFGPNMAIRRHLLTGLKAPYPEHLGPGTKYPVGDENAFFLQFSSPGAQDRIFISAAKVFHHVESENMTLRNILRRCYIAGRGYEQIRWPASAQNPAVRTSTLGLIISRLGSCRSFHELACISVRYIGYLIGSFKLFSR